MTDLDILKKTAAIAVAIMERFGNEDAAREGFKRAMQNSCTDQQFSDLLAFPALSRDAEWLALGHETMRLYQRLWGEAEPWNRDLALDEESTDNFSVLVDDRGVYHARRCIAEWLGEVASSDARILVFVVREAEEEHAAELRRRNANALDAAVRRRRILIRNGIG